MNQRKVMLGILLVSLLAGSTLVVNAATTTPPVLQTCVEGSTKIVGVCSYQCTNNQWLLAKPCTEAQTGQVKKVSFSMQNMGGGLQDENGRFVDVYSTSSIIVPADSKVTVLSATGTGAISFSALDANDNVLAAGGVPISSGIVRFTTGPSMVEEYPFPLAEPVTVDKVEMVNLILRAPLPKLGDSQTGGTGTYYATGSGTVTYTYIVPTP